MQKKVDLATKVKKKKRKLYNNYDFLPILTTFEWEKFARRRKLPYLLVAKKMMTVFGLYEPIKHFIQKIVPYNSISKWKWLTNRQRAFVAKINTIVSKKKFRGYVLESFILVQLFKKSKKILSQYYEKTRTGKLQRCVEGYEKFCREYIPLFEPYIQHERSLEFLAYLSFFPNLLEFFLVKYQIFCNTKVPSFINNGINVYQWNRVNFNYDFGFDKFFRTPPRFYRKWNAYSIKKGVFVAILSFLDFYRKKTWFLYKPHFDDFWFIDYFSLSKTFAAIRKISFRNIFLKKIWFYNSLYRELPFFWKFKVKARQCLEFSQFSLWLFYFFRLIFPKLFFTIKLVAKSQFRQFMIGKKNIYYNFFFFFFKSMNKRSLFYSLPYPNFIFSFSCFNLLKRHKTIYGFYRFSKKRPVFFFFQKMYKLFKIKFFRFSFLENFKKYSLFSFSRNNLFDSFTIFCKTIIWETHRITTFFWPLILFKKSFLVANYNPLYRDVYIAPHFLLSSSIFYYPFQIFFSLLRVSRRWRIALFFRVMQQIFSIRSFWVWQTYDIYKPYPANKIHLPSSSHINHWVSFLFILFRNLLYKKGRRSPFFVQFFFDLYKQQSMHKRKQLLHYFQENILAKILFYVLLKKKYYKFSRRYNRGKFRFMKNFFIIYFLKKYRFRRHRLLFKKQRSIIKVKPKVWNHKFVKSFSENKKKPSYFLQKYDRPRVKKGLINFIYKKIDFTRKFSTSTFIIKKKNLLRANCPVSFSLFLIKKEIICKLLRVKGIRLSWRKRKMLVLKKMYSFRINFRMSFVFLKLLLICALNQLIYIINKEKKIKFSFFSICYYRRKKFWDFSSFFKGALFWFPRKFRRLSLLAAKPYSVLVLKKKYAFKSFENKIIKKILITFFLGELLFKFWGFFPFFDKIAKKKFRFCNKKFYCKYIFHKALVERMQSTRIRVFLNKRKKKIFR